MKKIFSILILIVITVFSFAQDGRFNNVKVKEKALLNEVSVGGTGVVDPSSIMDVESTDKGILIPRMTAAQRNAIPSPEEGLWVYTSDLSVFSYYNGSAWIDMVAGGAGTPNFLFLLDTPNDYTGFGNDFVRVKVTEDGLEFVDGSSINVSEFNNDAGYLTSEVDGSTSNELNISMTSAGGVLSLTDGGGTITTTLSTPAETDPVFSASPAGGIIAGDITNWNTAYGWGDHSTEGYLTSEVDGSTTNELNTTVTIVGDVLSITDPGGAITTDLSVYKDNATHTGEVTGSSVLTVDKTAISNKTAVTGAPADFVLVTDGDDADNLKKVGLGQLLNPAVSLNSLTDVTLTSAAQGEILYKSAGDWVNLPVGTSGQVLQTNGAAANPSWVTPSGGADGNGIYDGSGSLSANTTVTQGANDLQFHTTANANTLFVRGGSFGNVGVRTNTPDVPFVANGYSRFLDEVHVGAASGTAVQTFGNIVSYVNDPTTSIGTANMVFSTKNLNAGANVRMDFNFQNAASTGVAQWGVQLPTQSTADFYWNTGTGVGTEKMRLTSSGSLGIGVSPSEKLHVGGNLRVDGYIGANVAPITGVPLTLESSGTLANLYLMYESDGTTLSARGIERASTVKFAFGSQASDGLNTGTTNYDASALLNLDGGATDRASLKFHTGVAPTGNALSQGVMWSTGTTLNFYDGTTTHNLLAGGADGNGIYDGSGSLSAATTVTQGGNTLTFTGGNVAFNSGSQYIFNSNGTGAGGFQVTTSPTTNNVQTFVVTNNATTTARKSFSVINDTHLMAEVSGNGTTNNLLLYDYAGTLQNAISSGSSTFLNATAGNVGIGITTPTSKLHVGGNARIDGTLTVNQAAGVSLFEGTGASNSKLTMKNANTGALSVIAAEGAGGERVNMTYVGSTAGFGVDAFYQDKGVFYNSSGDVALDASGDLYFGTTTGGLGTHTTKMQINTSGVGIGQAPSSDGSLTVSGSIKINAGALFIADVVGTPSTPTGGGKLYVEGGALKYVGSSGTVTTLANP